MNDMLRYSEYGALVNDCNDTVVLQPILESVSHRVFSRWRALDGGTPHADAVRGAKSLDAVVR